MEDLLSIGLIIYIVASVLLGLLRRGRPLTPRPGEDKSWGEGAGDRGGWPVRDWEDELRELFERTRERAEQEAGLPDEPVAPEETAWEYVAEDPDDPRDVWDAGAPVSQEEALEREPPIQRPEQEPEGSPWPAAGSLTGDPSPHASSAAPVLRSDEGERPWNREGGAFRDDFRDEEPRRRVRQDVDRDPRAALRGSPIHRVRHRLQRGSPDLLQEAMVLMEVLGPPRALKPYRPPHPWSK